MIFIFDVTSIIYIMLFSNISYLIVNVYLLMKLHFEFVD